MSEHTEVAITTRTPTTSVPLILAAAFTSVVLWASAFVVVRMIGDALTPGAIALGRQIVATVTLAGFVAVRSLRTGTAPHLPRRLPLLEAAGWGLVWLVLYSLAFNTALRSLDAGTTSFIVNIAPILVALLAAVLLRERIEPRLMAGMAVALGGVGLIGYSNAFGTGHISGVLLALAAAVCYAVAATWQKRILRDIDGYSLILIGCAVSVVALSPFLPELIDGASTAPASVTWLVVLLGVGPTAIGFSTFAYVLARVSAGRAAAATYLVPLTVLIMAWLFTGETPTPLALAGGAVTLGGVAIATLHKPKTTTVPGS